MFVMKRILPLGVCLAIAGTAFGQAPAAAPAFEVASIKPAPPMTPAMITSGKMHVGMKIDAARVDIGFLSLMDLICKAYEVKQYQVTGPSWLSTERFDIVAKMPEGATKEQVPKMLQTLLAERFKLQIHREKKDQPVYALVVGKGGPKLKDAEEIAPAAPTPETTGPNGAPAPASTGSSQVNFKQTAGGAVVTDGEGRQQKISASPDGKTMHFEISRTTMDEMAEGMWRFVDRPIVNQTGLTGKYQMTLDIAMADIMAMARAAGVAVPNAPGGGAESGKPADAASDPTGNSIFASFQNAGLKLEPKKLPLDFIVVDHAEKVPTEN